MESFGAFLKREREAKKVSLEEICQATKIRRAILEAIEGDKLEVLPPEVFVRGFIEAYAKYIGLDPEEVIYKYKEWKNGSLTKGGSFYERKREASKKYVFIGIILLMAMMVLFISHLKQAPMDRTGEATLQRSQDLQQDVSSPNNLSSSSPAPSQRGQILPPSLNDGAQQKKRPSPTQQHLIVLEAIERTWVEIKEGSSPPFDITLYPGDRYTRRAPSFELLIGNAGGIKVTFDDRQLGPLGEVGQVVRLTLPSRDRDDSQ